VQWVNVQVIADLARTADLASPALPGARYDMGAPPASTASSRPSTSPGCKRWPKPPPGAATPRYACGSVAVAWIRHRRGRCRAATEVNYAHAHRRGPDERANGELKSWKILRKIRARPSRMTTSSRLFSTCPRGLTKPERLMELNKCERAKRAESSCEHPDR
jgi:hypothetical protein